MYNATGVEQLAERGVKVRFLPSARHICYRLITPCKEKLRTFNIEPNSIECLPLICLPLISVNNRESTLTELDMKQNKSTVLLIFSICFLSSKKKLYLLLSYAASVRPSVCPSVVCRNNFFCGNLIFNTPIVLKFGLNVDYEIVHVRNSNCKLEIYATYDFCCVVNPCVV